MRSNEKEISHLALWELECAWFEGLQQSAGLASSIGLGGQSGRGFGDDNDARRNKDIFEL
jgi:hypothetical protein